MTKQSKTPFFIILICLSALLFPLSASADIVFGKAYREILHKYLTQSKNSITVAMYFIIINPKDKTGAVNELVDGLIAAKNRGVKVKVILEDSKLDESRLAYEKLRENNIAVYFDTPEHLLHTKAVVIDDRYVFVGSANWSNAALEDNYEATSFEDSPPDALALREYIDNIPVHKNDVFVPSKEGVTILADFLLSPRLGRRLLKARAFKQFDLYLLLCKLQQETGKSSFVKTGTVPLSSLRSDAGQPSSLRGASVASDEAISITAEIVPSYIDIDYDFLAKNLGYASPDNLKTYRNERHYYYERAHRLLKRLKRYGLIDYYKGKVTLKANNVKEPGEPLIKIPFEYWEYGYSGSLSGRAKYMYLISLYEAARSTKYPFWFRSQEDMSRMYGISDTTISLGLLELEAEGIIEITRDKPAPPDYSVRKANIYRLLSLPRK